jgi:ribosomal protein S27E
MPEFQGSEKRVMVVAAKPASEVSVGGWYNGFTCRECGKQFAVFDDPSGGKAPIKLSGSGHIRVACSHCDAEHVYETSEVESFQAG